MQEITEKLYRKMVDQFKPVAEQLAKEGFTAREISAVFQTQLRIKTNQYYKLRKPISEIVGDVITSLKNINADSKAEAILYQMLLDRQIQFEFQYKIGPYRADYLFSKFLVLEIDGPQHDKKYDDKRDLYMRKMGYKIIRVPIALLMWDTEAVIDEVQEVVKNHGKIPNSH